MINQPLISRLFAAGSLTGMGDLMGGDGISMEEWNVPFTSKNNVISVNDARARRAAPSAPPPTAISTGRTAPWR